MCFHIKINVKKYDRIILKKGAAMNKETGSGFWEMLDALAGKSKLVIDRKKGSAHPKYPNIIYPVDYGYLNGTTSMDGGGIDVWLGSEMDGKLNAILCTADILKNDSEIKLLIGCTQQEKRRNTQIPQRKPLHERHNDL